MRIAVRQEENKMDGFEVCFLLLFILLAIVIIISIPDELYFKQIAKDNANGYCRGLGFDQYKEMSRIGIWSINPVAIKCEYAERYTDLGVRTAQS